MDIWQHIKNTLFLGNQKRNYAKELDKQEQEIVLKWEVKWKQENTACDSTGRDLAGVDGLDFSKWINAEFDFLDSSAKYNKFKNFMMKFLSLFVFFIVYGGFLYFYKNNLKDSVAFSVVLIIPSYILSKWIGVKKYQETWSRHTANRARLLREMVKYIYGLPPYDVMDKNIRFIEGVLKLSEKNINKFQVNIETKEDKLGVLKWKELFKG